MDLYWRFCDPVIVPEAFSAWGSSLPIQSYHPSVGSSRSSWNSFVPTLFLTIPQTLLIPYSSGFLALVIIHLLSSSQSGRSVPTDQSQVSSFLHLNLHSQQQTTTTKKKPKANNGKSLLVPNSRRCSWSNSNKQTNPGQRAVAKKSFPQWHQPTGTC